MAALARTGFQWQLAGEESAGIVDDGRCEVEDAASQTQRSNAGRLGDTIFVSSPDPNKNLLLFCIDRKDGKVRWQKQIATGDIKKGNGNMASPSPVTDGKAVYALFGTGDLAALDFSGRILWQRNLGADYGRFAIM